jgi:sporulation protein YlmC with PRC-barrel domain
MRLSELMTRAVVTESGRKIGHVHDVRATQRSSRLVVTGLLIGEHAFLEHFGFGMPHGKRGGKLHTEALVVPVSEIVRVAPDKVVVRDGTEITRV